MVTKTSPKYNQVTDSIACELKKIVGEKFVIYNNQEALEPYSHDEIPGTEYRAMPEIVVRPRTGTEISEIMKLSNKHKIPVTPRGAGSGLSGGAVPIYGGIVLSVDRMNSILELDKENMMIVVEPGVIANDINEYLRDHKLFYAGYPMSMETCHIGGNVAENAGGGKAVKYGVTSRYVLGLEVVMPNGEIVEFGGKLIKDVSGLNMVQLMVGSEGILGIFTRIVLKLIPLPKYQADLLCLFRSAEEAINVVPKIMTQLGIIPTSIEFMDDISVKASCDYLNESLPYKDCGAMLLITVDGMEMDKVQNEYIAIGKFCQSAGSYEVFVADNPSTSERIWRVRRNIADAFNVYSNRQSGEDIVVPPKEIAKVLNKMRNISETYSLLIPCFGHAGDGNIHARIVCEPKWSNDKWKAVLPVILEDIYAMIRESGGRISGEHGIGCKRKKYLDRVVSNEYIEIIKSIKLALDPNIILNPGKIFDYYEQRCVRI